MIYNQLAENMAPHEKRRMPDSGCVLAGTMFANNFIVVYGVFNDRPVSIRSLKFMFMMKMVNGARNLMFFTLAPT